MKVPRTMITTVVAVQNRHADCRLPQFTGCKLTINSDRIRTVFFLASYTVSNCRKRPENEVSDRLRTFTKR
jgi:hypothetical protein